MVIVDRKLKVSVGRAHRAGTVWPGLELCLVDAGSGHFCPEGTHELHIVKEVFILNEFIN